MYQSFHSALCDYILALYEYTCALLIIELAEYTKPYTVVNLYIARSVITVLIIIRRKWLVLP